MNPTSLPAIEKQHQEILLRNLHSSFARHRKELAHLSARLKAATARLAQIVTAEFQTLRYAMRWSAGGCLALGIVVGMAALLECVILQEFSRELAANIKRGLAADVAWLTAENINQAMTVVLITCFVAALLITKRLTNFQPNWEAFRTCPLALRSIHGWRVAWKVIGKLVYLFVIGAIFYAIDVRQKAASDALATATGIHESGAQGSIFGNVSVDQRDAAVKPAETPYSGYRGLYCLDFLLHTLVLFGLQGVTAKGISLRDIFSSESRSRRRVTYLRTEVVKRANGIVSLLTSVGLTAEARQHYLGLLTERERQEINEAYGRPTIVNGRLALLPDAPDEGGESGPSAPSAPAPNSEDPDSRPSAGGSVHPFETTKAA